MTALVIPARAVARTRRAGTRAPGGRERRRKMLMKRRDAGCARAGAWSGAYRRVGAGTPEPVLSVRW